MCGPAVRFALKELLQSKPYRSITWRWGQLYIHLCIYIYTHTHTHTHTLFVSAGKESAYNVRDLGLIPGLGRSPGDGKGYPLQCSGLENSMDCTVSPWGRKELDSTEWLSLSYTIQLTEIQSENISENSYFSIIENLYLKNPCFALENYLYLWILNLGLKWGGDAGEWMMSLLFVNGILHSS